MTHIHTPACSSLSRLVRPRRILLTSAAVFASALAMTIASSERSQAQSTCSSNFICLFDSQNHGGPKVWYRVGTPDMKRPPAFNDRASSFRNNTGSRWCAYTKENYTGERYVIAPWQAVTSLGSWDNTFSSIKRC